MNALRIAFAGDIGVTIRDSSFKINEDQ